MDNKRELTMKKDFVFICHTCKRDEALLPFHFSAIRRVCPDAEVRYIVDESDIDMNLPHGSKRICSNYERNGNLRGMSALCGIVFQLTTAAAETDCIPVKIDSDIILRGVEWLTPLQTGAADMVGISPRVLYCASGACYGVAPELLPRIAEFITARIYWDLQNDRIEDETLSMMAAIVSDPCRVVIRQNYHPDMPAPLSCIFRSDHFAHREQLEKVEGFIDCGDSAFVSDYCRHGFDAVAVKRRAMVQALSLPRVDVAHDGTDSPPPTPPRGQGISFDPAERSR